MPSARIIGTGYYVPERVVTNDDLANLTFADGPRRGERMLDTNDAWIRERTGIRERHTVIAPGRERYDSVGIGTSDLALPAARMALADAGVAPEELDLIIVCSMTPDRLLPSTACLLQPKLGATNAGAFDVVAACSGFVYGLSVAEKFLKSGQYRTLLLVGAELFSNRLDWTDRNTAVLFGDGAGACVLRADDQPGGVLSTHLHADGTGADVLCVKAGGSFAPPTVALLAGKEMYVTMQGQDLFKIGVRRFSEAVQEALDANGLTASDLDLLIPHQANARIIEMVARRFSLDMSKVVVNIDRFGNTTAASIPIAIHQARQEGRLQPGMNVVLAAFGGGLTWGSALIRW